MDTKKHPWTKGEKFLLGAVLLTVALASLGSLWWNQTSAQPFVSVPTPAMPAHNAFGVLLDAAGAETGDPDDAMSTPPPQPIPGSPWRYYPPAEKAALVRANATALTLLHQGLALPYQNPPIRSFNTTLPYYARFRRLARLTTLVCQVREAQGDWDGAFQSGLDAVQLGEKLPRGAPLIGELVGVACEAIGRRSLWREVDHLNAAQAKAAAHRLQSILDGHVPYSDTLQEDEWETQAGLMEIFHRPGWRSELRSSSQVYDSGMGSGPTMAQQAQMFVISKTAILDDYTAAMDQLRLDARKPYAASVAAPPRSDSVTLGLTDFLPAARFKEVYTVTENALLLVTLGLRAYRLEHGTYPTTLTVLTPAYLKRVPDDPCALSGPLHYKRLGSKCVLYSVGPDGKDDGGKPIFDAGKAPPKAGERDSRYMVLQDSQGDIVAGLNQ